MQPMKKDTKRTRTIRDISTVLYRNKQGTCVASSNHQPDSGLYL